MEIGNFEAWNVLKELLAGFLFAMAAIAIVVAGIMIAISYINTDNSESRTKGFFIGAGALLLFAIGIAVPRMLP